jgi:hypothetical protein
MIEIELTSDIDRAIKEVGDFFWKDVPYALSRAINDAAFEIRDKIVNETYPQAFEVRNARFAGVAFRVLERAKYREIKTGGVTQAVIGSRLDRDWLDMQAHGGTKTPRRGQHLAVPVHPDQVRASGGRVRANKKPLALGATKNHYVLRRGGEKIALMKKGRGKRSSTAVYFFMRSAPITKRFRFYEDAEATARLVVPKSLALNMRYIVAKSRRFS